MSARVLFFGATAHIAKKREVSVTVGNGLTANGVLEAIVLQIPSLSSYELHISLNQQYADGNEIISDGDELAIFTAVSGG
ncbi:MAG: MoaD/ThiS family protein [Chloracidobacterium sp.]|nr:MoaD/ThiS family protein [Chloracidobacterium sp.]